MDSFKEDLLAIIPTVYRDKGIVLVPEDFKSLKYLRVESRLGVYRGRVLIVLNISSGINFIITKDYKLMYKLRGLSTEWTIVNQSFINGILLQPKYGTVEVIAAGKRFVIKEIEGESIEWLLSMLPLLSSIKDHIKKQKKLEKERKQEEARKKKEEELREKERIKKEKRRREQQRIKKLEKTRNSLLSSLDSDGNGVLDIIEGGDFLKLLTKHQKEIKEIDRTYIRSFVQVSNFLKSQSESLQEVFIRIYKVENQKELESLLGLLNNQIHTYEQILFHSLNMIVSLIDGDDLTFYEIYETFDKLNVFDSEWQRQFSQKLSDVSIGLMDLMESMHHMERNMTTQMGYMNYLQGESIKDLGRKVSSELKGIDSSIRWNNLYTLGSSYQTYKLNKNLRS